MTAVDKSSITVAADAVNREIEGRRFIIPAQPPRKFAAVGPLAEGGYLKAGNPRAQYRLSDVKVGDKVFFDWRRVGNVYEVHYVGIRRRPGGRVPPSPGEKPGEKNPWHEQANAFQDLEEKGIPLPEKYRPRVNLVLEARARKLKPTDPIPDDMRAFLGLTPLAPMPRLAIPRIPPAKP